MVVSCASSAGKSMAIASTHDPNQPEAYLTTAIACSVGCYVATVALRELQGSAPQLDGNGTI